MKTINTCLSPNLLPLYELENKTVVVADILRATSCIVTGIACGVEGFMPFENVEECRKMGEQGFLRGGERNSVRIEGFELSNSPFEYMSLQNQKIAMTTTNGTKAIRHSQRASQILIGAFLNISALANYLKTQDHVLLVCAARKDIPNIEDTLFAGTLASKILQSHTQTDDTTLIAMDLYDKNAHQMMSLVQKADHYRRLKALNLEKDLEFCFSFDIYDSIPIFAEAWIKPL